MYGNELFIHSFDEQVLALAPTHCASIHRETGCALTFELPLIVDILERESFPSSFSSSHRSKQGELCAASCVSECGSSGGARAREPHSNARHVCAQYNSMCGMLVRAARICACARAFLMAVLLRMAHPAIFVAYPATRLARNSRRTLLLTRALFLE